MEPGLQMLLEGMRDDIRELKTEVKGLQQVRWITYGKVTGIASICSVIMFILGKIYFN